jgi:hypothetical protein
VGDYLPGHYTAPNRYVVPALPGLAVLAGFGLADLAALAGRALGRGRAGWVAGVVGVVLGVAVAAPGVAQYLDGARGSGRLREQGQRALAATLPSDAVVFGAYAPTLLFDTRLTTLTPWPTADANVRDPVGRFGVTHLLVGSGPADPTAQVAGLIARPTRPRLARIPWGGGHLLLYGPSTGIGAGISPVAPTIDYDPVADPSAGRR